MAVYSVMSSHDDVISRSAFIQFILSLPVALKIAAATGEPDVNISTLTCRSQTFVRFVQNQSIVLDKMFKDEILLYMVRFIFSMKTDHRWLANS